MTSIAQETRTTAATAPAERAVFVTDDDRRSRIARRLALIVLAIAGLWVAALAVGMLGLGQLPGVSLPLPGTGGTTKQQLERPSSAPVARNSSLSAQASAAREHRQAALRASAATVTPTQRSRTKARSAVSRTPAAPVRRRGGAPAAATTPPPAQAATAPRLARGLERRGLTAPPGQTQKAAATGTATPPGQTREPKGLLKQTDTTAPTPPAPPPAPPGQQKPDKPPAKA
jgi:hypothetical protein